MLFFSLKPLRDTKKNTTKTHYSQVGFNYQKNGNTFWQVSRAFDAMCEIFFKKKIVMPRLTIAQRTWVCIEFARVGNAHEVLRRWRHRWHNIRHPTVRTILKTFEKFEGEGTTHNLNKERSGRRRTVRTPGNIALVQNGSTFPNE